MKPSTKRKIKKVLSPLFRLFLKNKNFSIISNNCWGGFYYDRYGLIYNSPTIGLFIPPEDYLRFLSKIDYYLKLDDLVQIEPLKAKCYLMLKRKEHKGWITNVDSLIIGKLDDIEIVFLHYSSFADAKNKWNRRKKRVNFNNLIVKFNDQNEFKTNQYYQFENLPFKNKIFFTSNKELKNCNYVFFVKKYEKKYGFVFDDMHVNFNFLKYVNDLERSKK